MTINALLQHHNDIEIDILLAHVLQKPKEFLYIHSNEVVPPTVIQAVQDLAIKRRQKIPIAYLLGHKYFYGLSFKVTPDVLIPRPETEWLVDKAMSIAASRKVPPQLNIIDVGTGSGCIAISLATHLPPGIAHIRAADISSAALAVAQYNAQIHNAEINVIRTNLLEGVTGKFDIIIANLPYVPWDDYLKFQEQLQYEPQLAITDGSNNFTLYERLLNQAQYALAKNGTILLEIDPSQKQSLLHINKELHSPMHMEFYNDQQGLLRYCILTASA